VAETIKGISIVIGAETTGLSAALSEVNKKSRDIQTELRQVEKLLKFDPKNTELLAQKQKLLADAVGNSKDKLDSLKAAQEQVNEQFRKGEINEGQYRAFQREVAKAEQELSKLEGQLKDTGGAAKKLDVDLQGLGNKLKGFGTTLSAAVTAPIIGGFFAVTQGTKELRGDLATLATNAKVAGQDMGVLDDAMTKLYAVTGETDSNVEGLSELLATGFRDEQLSTLLDSLYGASIKFKDTMKFEGIADGLQETLATGAAIGPFAELLERSGIALDGFNAGLTAAIANGTEEQYVLGVLAKTGLAQTYEAYRKNNEEMVKAEEANFRMQQAFAQLGATLEPLITPMIEGLANLVSKFTEMDPAGQKVVLVIAGIVAAIGPLLVVVGSLMTALPALGAAFTVLTGPVGLVVVAITALIAIGVALYKNWDEVKAQLLTIWASILEVTRWEAFKTGFLNVWNGIVTGLKGYVNGIIRLVNTVIDALNTIQVDIPDWVPVYGGSSFGINIPNVRYLATGGIVTRPTLAMIGEAGPEAVIPLNQMGPSIGTINIYGSNASEIWSKFERELNRRGVRI
jgi:phage-related minor tail protein